MELVYVDANIIKDGHVHCSLHAAVISFVASYLDSDRLRINLVQSQNASRICQISHTRSQSKNLLESTQVPDLVQQCSLPAMVMDGDYLARAGLCSVLRQMVKISSLADPKRHWSKLLGFKGICLKACAEVSPWTKFCEVELPEAIGHALQFTPTSRSLPTLTLPLELCKLEHHLSEPAIIPNISKKRQEALKKIKNSPIEEFQKLCLTPNAQENCSENLPGLQHLYAEGTEFTLTDLVLFPPISMYLCYHKERISAIAEKLPLVVQWYKRLLNETSVKNAAIRCGIETVNITDADLLIVNDMFPGTILQPDTPSSRLSLRDTSKKKKVPTATLR